MRLAVLIIGLLLGVVVFFQVFVLTILSSMTDDETLSAAAGGGIVVVVSWLIASAFVMAFPLFSAILFALAGLIGIGIAGSSEYSDMKYWGGLSLFLAVLSFIGWLGKRKDRRAQRTEHQRQVDRDNRMEQLLTQQAPRAAPTIQRTGDSSPATCPQCGHTNAPWTKFCAECGGNLQLASTPT